MIFDFDWKGLLLLVDIAGTNPFPADPARVLHHARPRSDIESYGGVWVGSGPCGQWPLDRNVDTAEVRFGAVNLAGAFSGWSEPTTITLPLGCDCDLGGAAGGAGGGASAAILGACLLLLERRRRLGRRTPLRAPA